MAQTPYDTGGGGLAGTAGSICAISPDDLVGTIGNLISRLEAAETAISSILGADLFTERLSNLSEQVGWVYGVEYMGVPGWIQTEYGTLIPPPGFTLSSNGFTLPNACTGEDTPYQGVVMDENGVLQFGFTDVGELCGTSVENWDAAGTPDYYIYRQEVSMTTGSPYEAGRNITKYADSGLGTDEGFSISVEVANPGLYQVSVSGDWGITRVGSQAGVWCSAGIETAEFQGSSDTRGSASISSLTSINYDHVGVAIHMDGNDDISLTSVFDLPALGTITAHAAPHAATEGVNTVNSRGVLAVVIVRLGKGSI